ncbi:chromosome segregation protein SMC [Luminiphilus sp.]|nr:chromosome segregation protein SMC [Luminiphilus sp.]
MRLKSIKLAGFKSFVDPTTVQFPGNMCAVVGPNGCGKSNIIDAVRWVMGESSAKTLRGESMIDVIFNGTTSRQPVSQASIELVFDNAMGKIAGEFAAYNEISVRRVVTREALSEYYLNGAKCRRRDITDLFLGTGLGPRSYAIIEQGVVSRLIESKPEELRVFIEEAAGISKYKERRRETENRMRRTSENLERLTDLRDELQRNLAHLDRQARAAEKYSELKVEERVVQSELFTIQWRTLSETRAGLSGEIDALDVKREAAVAEITHNNKEMEAQRAEQSASADALNNAQETYYGIGGEVTRVEQALRFAQERRGELQRHLDQTRSNLEQTREHLDVDSRRLGDWQSELERVEPALAQFKTLSQEADTGLAVAEAARQTWSQTWDQFNDRAREPSQTAEVQQSRIAYLEQVLTKLQERLHQQKDEWESLSNTVDDTSASPLEDKIGEADRNIAAFEEEIARLREELEASQTAIEQSRQQQDDVRASIQETRGLMSSLVALQQAASDEKERIALNDWIEAESLRSEGSVYSTLDVEPGWETAVEQVLGEALSATVVNGRPLEKLPGVPDIPAGAFVFDDQVDPPADVAGTLAAKARGPARVAHWLQSVKVASDLDEAKGILPVLANGESVVTPDGHWIGQGWHRRRSAADAAAGIIARQAQLDTMSEELGSTRQEADALEKRIGELLQARAELEKQLSQAQQAQQAAVRERAEWVAEHRALATKVEQQVQRRNRLKDEIDDVQKQYGQEQEHLADARNLLSKSLDQMELDRVERERLQAERESLNEQLAKAREASREASDVLMRNELNCQNLQSQVATLKETVQRLEAQLRDLESRESQLNDTLPTVEDPDAENRARLSELLEERLTAERDLNVQRARAAEIEAKLRQLEQTRLAHEQTAQGIQSDIERLRLKDAEAAVRLETLSEEVARRDAVPEEVAAGLPEDASEADWRAKVELAASRINRLGPINLAAIDEHAKASERKQYLDAQNADLEAALETLESAIRKIDKETRQRFKDTFDQINIGFAELFPRVFGGGTACLEMTGDDLLDTGVAIFARPPGKKNSTIHLLSGGEKAMTAIALVFSIFQLNPAPFCMLDEVDAPLDDANVGRYARIVREMSEKVQFVFITHNKITMEAADQLMGVTMQEPGVSRLVTVDVEEAAQLAAS